MTLGQYKAMATPPAVTPRAATSLHPRRRSAGQDEAHAAPPTQGGLGFVPVGNSCGARRAAAPIGVVPARVAFPRAAANAAAAPGARCRQRQADGARAPSTAPRHEASVAGDGRGKQVRVHVGDRGGGSGARSSSGRRGRSRAGPSVEEPREHGCAGCGLSSGLGKDVGDGPASLVLGLLLLRGVMVVLVRTSTERFVPLDAGGGR